MIVVAALYQFVTLEDYVGLREPLKAVCDQGGVRGTLLLAEEGINGTIAGPREGIDAVLAHLRSDPRMAELEHKESYTDEMPFNKMKVRLKKEIVTLGVPEANPNIAVGDYVDADEWNQLIADPDVLLIDTRNDYEVELGTFPGAIDPKTESFTEFVDYVDQQCDPAKHKKVAMFCTGGIRCEKASSLMLQRGFEKVYHLRGGILKYLETVEEDQNRWEGECFVFDDRVTVDKHLEPGQYSLCYACGEVLTDAELTHEHYQEGISCPKCFGQLSEEKMRSVQERQKQLQLKKKRGEI